MVHERVIALPTRLSGIRTIATALAPDAKADPIVATPSVVSAPSAQPSPPSVSEADRAADRAAIEKLLAALRTAGSALLRHQQTQMEELHRAAVELAISIAERLLHQRLQEGHFGIEEIVRRAIHRLPPRQPATVFLCPADLALFEDRLGGASLLPPGSREVQLFADPVLQRGACKVQAADVLVWADLPAQLAELRDALLESLSAGAATMNTKVAGPQ